jgi:hypothetical protein
MLESIRKLLLVCAVLNGWFATQLSVSERPLQLQVLYPFRDHTFALERYKQPVFDSSVLDSTDEFELRTARWKVKNHANISQGLQLSGMAAPVLILLESHQCAKHFLQPPWQCLRSRGGSGAEDDEGDAALRAKKRAAAKSAELRDWISTQKRDRVAVPTTADPTFPTSHAPDAPDAATKARSVTRPARPAVTTTSPPPTLPAEASATSAATAATAGAAASTELQLYAVRAHPSVGVVLLSHRHMHTRARLRPGDLCLDVPFPTPDNAGTSAGSAGGPAPTSRLGLVEVTVLPAVRADDPPHAVRAAAELAADAALRAGPPPAANTNANADGGRLFVMAECLVKVGAVRCRPAGPGPSTPAPAGWRSEARVDWGPPGSPPPQSGRGEQRVRFGGAGRDRRPKRRGRAGHRARGGTGGGGAGAGGAAAGPLRAPLPRPLHSRRRWPSVAGGPPGGCAADAGGGRGVAAAARRPGAARRARVGRRGGGRGVVPAAAAGGATAGARLPGPHAGPRLRRGPSPIRAPALPAGRRGHGEPRARAGRRGRGHAGPGCRRLGYRGPGGRGLGKH